MALCDAGLPSSRSADFLNKVTIPCPNNLSLYLLACHVVSSMSLDSVTLSLVVILGVTGRTESVGGEIDQQVGNE